MPEEGALDIRPGEKLMTDGRENSDNTYYGIGRGWAWEYTGHAMENTGYVYTEGEDNYLYFTGAEPAKPHVLRLHIKDTGVSGAEVYAGGLDLGRVALEKGKEAVIAIPAVKETGDDTTSDIENELEVDLRPEDGGRVEVDYLIFD